MDYPSFYEHDTTLTFWCKTTEDPLINEVRNSIVRHLRMRSFKVRLDAETKRHYSTICRNHHEGAKGELRFKMRLSGRCLEVIFFQNLVYINPNGGQYDFDRRQKMPYLIGKQYELERGKLADLVLNVAGCTLQLDRKLIGIDLVMSRRKEIEDFHGNDFYAKPPQPYNSRSATGCPVKDKEVVYFVDYMTRRWSRGIAYHNINNMWWVLLSSGQVRNMASFDLCYRDEIDDLKGCRIKREDIEQKLRGLLDKAVKAEAFERAIVLRDTIKKIAATKTTGKAA